MSVNVYSVGKGINKNISGSCIHHRNTSLFTTGNFNSHSSVNGVAVFIFRRVEEDPYSVSVSLWWNCRRNCNDLPTEAEELDVAIRIFLNQGAQSTAALNIGHVGLWKSSVLSVVAGIAGQFLTVNRCTCTEGVLLWKNAMVYAEGSRPDVEDRIRVVDSLSLENLYESTPHSLVLGICVYLRQVVSVVVADPVFLYRLNTNLSIMNIVGRNVLSGGIGLNFTV